LNNKFNLSLSNTSNELALILACKSTKLIKVPLLSEFISVILVPSIAPNTVLTAQRSIQAQPASLINKSHLYLPRAFSFKGPVAILFYLTYKYIHTIIFIPTQNKDKGYFIYNYKIYFFKPYFSLTIPFSTTLLFFNELYTSLLTLYVQGV